MTGDREKAPRFFPNGAALFSYDEYLRQATARKNTSEKGETDNMDLYSDSTFKKVVFTAVYAAIAAAVLYLFFKFILIALLPFPIAWCFAAALKRPVAFLSEKTRLPRTVFAVLFVSLLTGAVFTLLIFAVSRAVSEASRLLSALSSGGDGAADAVWGFFDGLAERIPFLGGENLDAARESIRNAAVGFLTDMLSKMPYIAANVASAVPGVLIFTLTLIISAVYMTADYRRIASYIVKKLPEKLSAGLFGVKKRMFSGAVGIFKAYTAIFFITFGELSIGFALLGRKYIFLPALLIAAVDILPVLGTGIALVPLSVVGFITGDVRTGIGMLALYGVISLVRQIIEPRLIGTSLGVHPLVTLISMYAGFRAFGVWGMIAAPLAAALFVGAEKSEENGSAANAPPGAA